VADGVTVATGYRIRPKSIVGSRVLRPAVRQLDSLFDPYGDIRIFGLVNAWRERFAMAEGFR